MMKPWERDPHVWLYVTVAFLAADRGVYWLAPAWLMAAVVAGREASKP